MLKSISWQTFLTTVTILLILYYVVISMVFYAGAIRRFFKINFEREDGFVKTKDKTSGTSQSDQPDERS